MLVNVERIEIIKGPVATLYGNCDPGGTINLVTKKPLTTKRAEINIYGGAWNHFRVEGDVTGPVNKNKTLLYRFNAGYDKANSFRNGYYTKSYQLTPSFTFIPGERFKINVDISLSHINTILDRGQPGFLNDTLLQSTPINLSVTQPGDYLQETDIASVVTGSYKITKNLNFNTGFLNYVTQQKVAEHGLNSYITNDSIFLYYDKWDYHTVTNTATNYLTWQHDIGRVSNHLLLGYDFVKSSINLGQQYFELPGEFGEGSGIVGAFSLKNPQYIKRPVDTYQVSDYDNDATDVDGEIYHTHGVYIQDEISCHKWRFLLGLRQEFYKGDDDDDDEGGVRENVFLPRINILYSIKPNLHIYVTYNNGFDPFEASTATQVFEDPFKPIKSQLLETGIKADLFNNQLSASLALYQLTVSNVAVNANDISNPNLYVQQGENRSRGMEAEINGNIFSNLSVSLNYSYCLAKVTKSKIESQVGMPAENAPKNASNSWIKYTFSQGVLKDFGLSAGHSHAGIRNTLQQGLTLPSYVILNGGLHYSGKHFTVAFNLYNITDKTYWMGAYNNINKWPGAPRNCMMSAGYTF
jgi:iron complex outermembrane receptor protein